jgi:integrase
MSAKGSITTSDYLSFEEYRRLVNCLWVDGEYKWSLYCVLSFGLALRISDVLNLVWDDVLEVDSATVEEKKTKKVRRIEIGDSVKKHVKAAYEKLGRPNRRTYIFSTKKSNGFPGVARIREPCPEDVQGKIQPQHRELLQPYVP